MDNKDLTIVVNTCDKNDDLWEPYFSMLKINWSDCPYPIVLNTETKSYAFDGFDIKSFGLYREDNPDKPLDDWSSRMIATLDKIDTPYVLFTLEDCYLHEKVNQQEFEKCFETIKKIKNFGAFYFTFMGLPIVYRKKLGIYQINPYADHLIFATLGIWKKSALKSLLTKGESVWQFERNAIPKAQKRRYKFFCAEEGLYACDKLRPEANKEALKLENPPHSPLQWDFDTQVVKGVFSDKAVDLLNSYNIPVDTSSRGVMYFRFENEDKEVLARGENGYQKRIYNMHGYDYDKYYRTVKSIYFQEFLLKVKNKLLGKKEDK